MVGLIFLILHLLFCYPLIKPDMFLYLKRKVRIYLVSYNSKSPIELTLFLKPFYIMTHTKTLRYDWNALKLKFFASRQESIRGFLEEEMGMKENGNTRKQTLGWSEEREDFRLAIYEQAKDKLSENLSETVYKPSIVELGEMHKEIIDMLRVSLSHIRSSCIQLVDGKEVITQIPDSQELSRIWKIIRIEKEQYDYLRNDENNFITQEEDLCE